MRTAVVGAGPVGSVLAMDLAARGHEVLVIDKDPGPSAEGVWERKGVMQFLHPHYWRAGVRDVMQRRTPQAWDAVIAAGGLPALGEGMPEFLTALACRRWVFETAVRRQLAATEGVTLRHGYADDVIVEGGRVTGLVVDGGRVECDLVLDASGRSGRLREEDRPPVEGGACGFSYVSRMYEALDGVTSPGPLPLGAEHLGYLVIVFPQDARTHSVLIVRASDDDALARTKEPAAFEAAMAAIPHTRGWTDPGAFRPITPVLPGGGLTNTFRRQVDDEHPAVPGLLFVGDAVSTTNPAAGRGVTLGLRQADALLGMLDHSAETIGIASELDAWCETNIRPWYDDHVLWDATVLRRWRGEGIDVDAPLSSDVICAAGAQDPSMMPTVLPFMGMVTGPTELRAVEEQARAVLRTGWRPPYTAGPSHDELAQVVEEALTTRSDQPDRHGSRE